MPTNSKGRQFNQADADLIFAQLEEQKRILKIDHQGSWTNDDALLMRDAAELLAGYGLQSLYDLQQTYRDLVYTIETVTDDYGLQYQYVATASRSYDDEGRLIILYDRIREASPDDLKEFEQTGQVTDQELAEVINKKTRQPFPLNEINNSRGDGFTWYTINFAGGIPVMVAWKEKTGLGKLGETIGKFLSSPGFQLFVLALSFIPIAPGAGSVLANLSNQIGTGVMGALGVDVAANPLLTKLVGDAAIRTVAAGGDLEKAGISIATGQVTGAVGSEVTDVAADIGGLSPESAKLAGDVAATVVRAEITNGSIPAALAINVGADLITEGAKALDIFGDDSAGTGLIYTPGINEDIFAGPAAGTGLIPTFGTPDVGIESEFGFKELVNTDLIGVNEINYWDIGVTPDGTMVGTRADGTVLAETRDGKTYNVTSIWDKLPSVDDLNKTLKGLTTLAVTGTQLTNIIEGKPVSYTGQRPPPGTVVRNADGGTSTYNYDGTVTRRLANGQVISSIGNIQQQAQMQNLTPLLAIGGIGLLLAS